jgi:biotin carboxyl carrier protein
MTYTHDDAELELSATTQPDGSVLVTLPDGSLHRVFVRLLPNGNTEITEGERLYTVPVVTGERGAVHIAWQGAGYVFLPTTGRRAVAGKKSGSLTAPMTGVVADVLVAPGQAVEAYQPLAVVEAMKVLATLEAPFAGTVSAVLVAKGDRVEHGATLVEIAPAERAPEGVPISS